VSVSNTDSSGRNSSGPQGGPQDFHLSGLSSHGKELMVTISRLSS
jgi:hypothetical protein